MSAQADWSQLVAQLQNHFFKLVFFGLECSGPASNTLPSSSDVAISKGDSGSVENGGGSSSDSSASRRPRLFRQRRRVHRCRRHWFLAKGGQNVCHLLRPSFLLLLCLTLLLLPTFLPPRERSDPLLRCCPRCLPKTSNAFWPKMSLFHI